MLDEKEYRKMVRESFERIAAAFDAVDPDQVEAELSQGALTISSGKVKTILSPQPSVRQIWLAAAAQGIAVHFSWDAQQKLWLDDKGLGLELYAFTSSVIQKMSGVQVPLKSLPPPLE